MADIFNGIWLANQANMRPAGASKLLIKIASDAAYYNLGAPRDAKIEDRSLTKPDGLLRNKGWGFRREISVPTIQASLTEIQLLDKLLVNTLAGFDVQLVDGVHIKNETAGLFGVKWKLMSKTDFEDFRSIEYTFAGNAKKSENQSAFASSGVTIGTPATGDVLATLSQSQVPANQVPDGVSLIEFKASVDAAYAPLGDFSKATWSFECIGVNGGGGRGLPRTHTIKFSMDIHGHQSSTTEVNLLDAILDNEIDLKITHMDGLVLTIPHTNVSLAGDWKSEGNADKERAIDFKAEGALVANAAGTEYTCTDGTTGWNDLFTNP